MGIIDKVSRWTVLSETMYKDREGQMERKGGMNPSPLQQGAKRELRNFGNPEFTRGQTRT